MDPILGHIYSHSAVFARWVWSIPAEHNADFTSSIFKPNGAGYSHNWSADVDSLIGAQLTANFAAQLSAVVQVVSERRYDNTYIPELEWANIRCQITPDFSVRVGRIVLPTFLVSDARDVGYTYPWVRPPAELYGLVPVTNSDGVDVSYRVQFGGFVSTLQAAYGNKTAKFPDGDTDRVHGL
jgi:hypothetical protein